MIIRTFEKDEAIISDVFIYLNHVYQNMKKAKQGNGVMDQWSQARKQKNIHSNGCKMNYKYQLSIMSKMTMRTVAGTKSDNPLLALLLASLGGEQEGDYLILKWL